MKVAIYARVSSDRQEVDLSIGAQFRALREYAAKNSYQVVREYVDEAESGRTADRPQFQRMIAEARRASQPFQLILVWKYSRFARNREDSAVFKSLLKKHGIRVISITEPFEDSPTGRLLEGIIEALDEFYSANQGQEVLRGMRESAIRGFYVASRAPYGYCRVKVKDGKRERTKLHPDDATAPFVQRMFGDFLQAEGLKEVLQAFNADGIASPDGGPWNKTTVHKVLTNEAYTGTLVWGRTSGSGQPGDLIRIEGAWEPLVDRETFNRVQELLHSRSFNRTHPRRTASHFLLSALVKCSVCGKAFVGQDAKSGKFAYYVCGTLMRQGTGACTAPYLPREKFEAAVVDKLKTHVLARENLEQLVKMVAEEMDAASIQWREHLEAIEREVAEVGKRLGRLYEALETRKLGLDDLAPRIQDLRQRQDKLQIARDGIGEHIRGRKKELVDFEVVRAYTEDLQAVLSEGSLTERKTFIKSFVKEILVAPDEAVIRYTMPLPPGQVEEEPVLCIVHDGGR